MKKKIKILIILLILLVLYIYIANITLFPKSIILMQGEKINLAKLWGIELKENENAVGILMSFGMGCVGCPSSQMETIEQACSIHGLDLEEVLAKLNEK